MRRPVLGTLFALACVSILSLPSTTGAVTLTSHIVKPHGITAKADRHVVVVRTVAPSDSDEDGYSDSEDNCPHEAYSSNGGCEPAPVAVPSESVAPAPAPTSSVAVSSDGSCGGITPYYGGGQCWAIPYDIVLCESGGSYTAYNPSGASGAYQLMSGGTGSPAEQDAAAAALWAGGAGQSNWDPSDPCSGY